MTTHELGRRCEALMRAAEREVEAIQKEMFEKLSPEEQASTNQKDIKIPSRVRGKLGVDAKKQKTLDAARAQLKEDDTLLEGHKTNLNDKNFVFVGERASHIHIIHIHILIHY